jgi:hypothetical protein
LFLQFTLYLPVKHEFNIHRMFFCFFNYHLITSEVNGYIYNYQIGPSFSLYLIQMVTEVLIIIKYGKGLFSGNYPDYDVIIFWSIFLIFISIYTTYISKGINIKIKNRYQQKEKLKNFPSQKFNQSL